MQQILASLLTAAQIFLAIPIDLDTFDHHKNKSISFDSEKSKSLLIDHESSIYHGSRGFEGKSKSLPKNPKKTQGRSILELKKVDLMDHKIEHPDYVITLNKFGKQTSFEYGPRAAKAIRKAEEERNAFGC